MKYLSVCSGMEAATVAWHPLGWEPIGFSEIEPFPAAILKHRFPNTPNYGDLTKYNEWPIEPGAIDLLVGGTPCQSFSVAGLRKGMSDPRGNLALTFLGLADKLRPRWIVWENVPGVLSSNGGRDFGAFLGALGQLGFGYAWRVLDAQHLGVPQRRRRVFVVATSSGDGRLAAEVLSLPEGLRGYLEARRKKGKGPAADAGEGADGDGGKGAIDCTGDGISGTVSCKWSKGSGGPAGDEHYNMVTTPYRKAKRAQSTTDDESWVEGDVSNTLNNFDLGDTRTTHAVVEPAPVISPTVTTCKGSRGGCSQEAIDEITAVHQAQQSAPMMFKVRGGVEANDGSQGGEPGKTAGKGFLGSEDKAFTLAATQDQWLAHCSEVAPTVTSSGPPYSRTGNERVEAEALVTEPKIIQASELRLQGKITEQDVCPTPKANTKSGDTEPLAFAPVAFQPGNLRRKAGADPSTEVFPTVKCDAGYQAPHVAIPPPPMAVRRLTPVECERLQGFPDNWSRIPWKGKPEEDCPDGPRYKACGNSMAVPVMRWIGQRIALVEQRTNGKNG